MNRIAGTLTRRLALLAACAALTALPLLAQDTAPPPPPPDGQTQGPPPGGPGGRGGMNPERRLHMMKEQLGLSDDQTAKIKAVLDESRGKMEGVRADTSLSREDARARSMAIHEQENSKIRAVLTADQQTKFDAMQQRMRRGPGGPDGPGGAGGPNGPPPHPPAAPQP